MIGAIENQPRISVVTPSFNQCQFVDATLRSVITQNYPELEYVVIDGGSSDGSADIIKRYEADLACWVSEPDHGHAHALNKGFSRTSGEIMCWINSSDVYFPWTFETVAQVFSQLPQVEWLMGMPSAFDISGGPRLISPASRAVNVYDVLAGQYRSIQQESVFWRRSLWERAGGRLNEKLTCAADLDLWLRFLRLAPLCFVPTVLGGFRVHGDRLGEVGQGLYEREAQQLYSAFVASYDRRSLARARLVRLIRLGRCQTIAERLDNAAILPWYAHPRVVFDVDRQSWTLR